MSLQQQKIQWPVIQGCGLAPTTPGRSSGIRQQQLSVKPGYPGRDDNGAIIGSGTPIYNRGRIAAGAQGIPNPAGISTFAPTVFRNPAGTSPGGLIDKFQQIDPTKTVFGHPWGGTGYRSISSQMQIPALTSWNGFLTHQADTPSVQPNARGKFFQKKVTPTVKMQFGVNLIGPRPDTAFRRQSRVHVQRPQTNRVQPTEKLSFVHNPPSFISNNTLRVSPMNSNYGWGGRWGTVKRSANHEGK
jgi:hypothetical protein